MRFDKRKAKPEDFNIGDEIVHEDPEIPFGRDEFAKVIEVLPQGLMVDYSNSQIAKLYPDRYLIHYNYITHKFGS